MHNISIIDSTAPILKVITRSIFCVCCVYFIMVYKRILAQDSGIDGSGSILEHWEVIISCQWGCKVILCSEHHRETQVEQFPPSAGTTQRLVLLEIQRSRGLRQGRETPSVCSQHRAGHRNLGHGGHSYQCLFSPWKSGHLCPVL